MTAFNVKLAAIQKIIHTFTVEGRRAGTFTVSTNVVDIYEISGFIRRLTWFDRRNQAWTEAVEQWAKAVESGEDLDRSFIEGATLATQAAMIHIWESK